jgi:hypothetical protein
MRRPPAGHYTMGHIETQAMEAGVVIARMMVSRTIVAPMSSTIINTRQLGSTRPHEYAWSHPG